jgi:cell division protein FtsB
MSKHKELESIRREVRSLQRRINKLKEEGINVDAKLQAALDGSLRSWLENLKRTAESRAGE